MTRRCWLALLLSLLLTVTHASAVSPRSANNSVLNAGGTTVLSDSTANGWAVTVSGGTVYLSGTGLPKTSHALQLAHVDSGTWYQSSSGWHSFTPAGAIASGPATTSPPTSSQKLNTTATPSPSATGAFKVVNGKIQAPNGTNWIGIGVVVHDSNLAASVNTILTDFPGVNLVRVDVDPLGSNPSVYAAAVASLTSKGIVVEFSDYTNSLGTGGGGAQGVIFTDSLLTNELAWFTSMASYYKNNPYVWLGSNNEPAWTYPDGKIYTSGPNSLSAWQRASYDAVRATGNNAPFLLEPGGTRAVNASFPWLLQSMMDPTQYATMTNVIWDPHCYSYQAMNSTDPAAEALSVAQMVAQSQTIHSADGVPAAIIGEYSTWGVGGTQNVTAVLSSGFGSGAWVLDANGVLGGPPGDPNATIYFGLLSGGRLTSFGRTVAAFTLANSRNQGTPQRPAGETLSLNTVSNVARNTAFTVSGSIAGVTDAPPLQYQDNGGSWTTLPAGASVTASSFSFQHPGMASDPAATIAIRDANNTSISAIGPPFVVLGARSASGTIVTPGAGSFTDGAHVYTVTAAGAAVQDGNDIPGGSGTSAGEWYHGLVYFQDAESKTWYTWNQIQLTATTAPGPVVTPPIEKPSQRPQGRRRPGIPQRD